MKWRTMLGLLFGLLSASAATAQQQSPYYAFYPSASGVEWKELRHNILGFSAEMPASWTFGVTGTGELAVAVLHPEGLNTGVFSPAYVTVEIGSVTLGRESLDGAVAATLRGFRARHASLRMIDSVTSSTRAGRSVRSFRIAWQSRSGHQIVEAIDLVADGPRALSIAVRATGPAFESSNALHFRIARSVRPLPRQF